MHTNITKWTQQQINHNLDANDNTHKPSSMMDGRVKTIIKSLFTRTTTQSDQANNGGRKEQVKKQTLVQNKRERER